MKLKGKRKLILLGVVGLIYTWVFERIYKKNFLNFKGSNCYLKKDDSIFFTSQHDDIKGNYERIYKIEEEKIILKLKEEKNLKRNQFSDCNKNQDIQECLLKRYQKKFVLKKGQKLNFTKIKFDIFFVPHSHMDLGWLDTYEGYYKKKELKDSKEKRYVIGNIGYLIRFFEEEREFEKISVLKKMIKSGQIEILNWSVSSHDEACTYFEDMIRNFQTGFKWLKDKKIDVGKKPQGWMIDSFGHSLTSSYISKLTGADNLVIARMDDLEKKMRFKEKNLIFNWKVRENDDDDSIQVLTFPFHYNTFTTYWMMSDTPKNPLNKKFSLVKKNFLKFLNEMNFLSSVFKKRKLMLPLGNDFAFFYASEEFLRYDVLLIFLNSNNGNLLKNCKGRYSTVKEFFEALEQDEEIVKEIREDSEEERVFDFFPLIEQPSLVSTSTSTWTGFYTSRQFYKRKFQNFGKIVTISKYIFLNFFGIDEKKVWEDFKKIDITRGILTHHDAITGVSFENVMEDYQNMINSGLKKILKYYSKIVKNWIPEIFEIQGLDEKKFIFFNQLEDNRFNYQGNSSMLIILQNSGFNKNKYSEIKIYSNHSSGLGLRLTDEGEQEIPFLKYCFNNINLVKECYYTFLIKNLQKPGFNFFGLKPVNFTEEKKEVNNILRELILEYSEGKNIVLGLENDGTLKIKSEKNFEFLLTYYFFEGVKDQSDQAAGPYIMELKSQEIITWPIEYLNHQEFDDFHVVTGHTHFQQITLRIKIHKKSEKIPKFEISHFINLHESSDILPTNVELFVRYQTKIINNKIFFTDSNGLGLVKRKYQEKKESKFSQKYLKKESNIYPISRILHLKDIFSNITATLLVERPTGATSSCLGCMDISIARRTSSRDRKSDFMKIYEKERIINSHQLFYGESSLEEARRAQVDLDVEDIVIGGYVEGIEAKGYSREKFGFGNFFKDDFDKNVKVSFDVWEGDVYVTLVNLNDWKDVEIFGFQGRLEKYLKMKIDRIQQVRVNYNELEHASNKSEIQLKKMEIKSYRVTFPKKKIN